MTDRAVTLTSAVKMEPVVPPETYVVAEIVVTQPHIHVFGVYAKRSIKVVNPHAPSV